MVKNASAKQRLKSSQVNVMDPKNQLRIAVIIRTVKGQTCLNLAKQIQIED